jgi:L-arabinokinase
VAFVAGQSIVPMRALRVAFYISGHGLGHASRSIELMHALLGTAPHARIIVRTSAPPWIFERTAPASIELQSVEVDTGIAQIDSVRIDEAETVRRAALFYRDFDRRAADEATLLPQLGADIVIGDIPPLAFAAAAQAGIRSVAVSNFTWDWIYSAYDAFAPEAMQAIERAYSRASLALRLPLHGGFAPMAAVTRDNPFIARRSTRDRSETRRRLGIPDDRPAALPSFGAYGLDLPYDLLARSDRFTLVRGDFAELDRHHLTYQDLVAACDVVVSKPGYGIVSECIANDTALLYTSRGRFIEYDMFVRDMPRVLRCRAIAPEDLVAGRWADAIDALVQQPAPAERPRIDGAAIAARRVIELVGR